MRRIRVNAVREKSATGKDVGYWPLVVGQDGRRRHKIRPAEMAESAEFSGIEAVFLQDSRGRMSSTSDNRGATDSHYPKL